MATFWKVPPGPWPGQNTAIYRTGAIWASKWPLGPARALLECPAGHFGPVSGLPGRSKCRSVTHQNSAIYRTGVTWASKWPLGAAWVLLECPAGPFGPVAALPRRSKWPLKASSAATWPSKLPLRPAQVLVERPAGRLGLFWRCQGAQNGCSEPPVCLKRRFRLLKHCYR